MQPHHQHAMSSPPISKILEDLFQPLRAEWIHGFLFTDQPIHVQYLNSSSLFQRALQSQITVLRYPLSPPIVETTLKQPLSELHIRTLWLPVMSLQGFTLGVGVAHFDTTYAHGVPKMVPPHSAHNIRFCTNYEDNSTYMIHQSISDSALNQTTLIHIAHQQDVDIETVVMFATDGFQRVISDDSSIPINRLIPHMSLFSRIQLQKSNLICSITANNQPRDSQKVSRHNKQPTHPFDDAPFVESMNQFLGAKFGKSEQYFFVNAFPVHSNQTAVNNLVSGMRNPQLLVRMRDNSLLHHARSITESPTMDKKLISSVPVSEDAVHYDKEPPHVKLTQDSLMPSNNVMGRTDRCVSQLPTTNLDYHTIQSIADPSHNPDPVGTASATAVNDNLYSCLVLPLLNEGQAAGITEDMNARTWIAARHGTHEQAYGGTAGGAYVTPARDESSTTKTAGTGRSSTGIRNKLQENESSLPSNTERAEFTSTEKEFDERLSKSKRDVREKVSSSLRDVQAPTMTDSILDEIQPLRATSKTDSKSNAVPEEKLNVQENQRKQLEGATGDDDSNVKPVENRQIETGNDEGKESYSEVVINEDEAMRLRREMLRARRERNRASARRANERVKNERKMLIRNLEASRQQVVILRERERELRVENMELQKMAIEMGVSQLRAYRS